MITCQTHSKMRNIVVIWHIWNTLKRSIMGRNLVCVEFIHLNSLYYMRRIRKSLHWCWVVVLTIQTNDLLLKRALLLQLQSSKYFRSLRKFTDKSLKRTINGEQNRLIISYHKNPLNELFLWRSILNIIEIWISTKTCLQFTLSRAKIVQIFT